MKDNQLLGSKGYGQSANDPSVRGGGHIHINVDSIYLEGEESHIRANGGPDEDGYDSKDKNGGSGGYVYIKTQNTLKPNTFDEKSSIEAKGGRGHYNGFGGSGGIIIFEGDAMDDHYYRLKDICKANGGSPGTGI